MGLEIDEKKEQSIDVFMSLIDNWYSDRLTPHDMQHIRTASEGLYLDGKVHGMREIIEARIAE